MKSCFVKLLFGFLNPEMMNNIDLIMETQTLCTLMLEICQPQGRPALKHTLIICVLYFN